MGRKPRDEEPGAIHHVYARGNNRQAIFLDDVDRVSYLGLLGQAVVRMHWRCLSYCLMPNHVHLLVETPTPTLAAGMCRAHGQYARTFNRRHARVGHLFQGRFGSTRVRDDPHLWMVVAYIARNPPASGLCARPEEWPWASHPTIAADDGGAQRRDRVGWLDVTRLLDLLAGVAGGPGLEAYRRCVDGGDHARAARVTPMSSDAIPLLEQAVTRFLEEVPALKPMKLVVKVELQGRGDTQQFRVEMPGPKVTKDVAADSKVTVHMQRAFFNEMAKDAKVADWREAFMYGQAKASGPTQILQLIERVVEKHEERARTRRARH